MTESSQVSKKKPYSTPKLVVYGDIQSMTAGQSGSRADGSGSGGFNKGTALPIP